MEPITPRSDLCQMPDGTREVTYAKDQPRYLPLPALRTPDGKVLTMWRPTEEERQRLIQGEPITVVLGTFNTPLLPMAIGVGGMDLRDE